ncbi:MAG: hypothetical protein ACRDBG_13925 [Waterburya sp.]
MKITRLLILSIYTTILMSVLPQQKLVAHEYCESYIDCHQEPEDLEKVDYWTNYFFKLLRPEMRNKQITIHHTLYRRERAEIRRVVNKVVYQSCQRPHINHYYLLSELKRERDSLKHPKKIRSEMRDNHDNYWERSYYYDNELFGDEESWDEGYYWDRTNNYFFEGLYRDLTDAVFYARHPEISHHVSRRDTMNWSGEWSFIRQHFADFEQEKFLKQHLIPICDRYKY